MEVGLAKSLRDKQTAEEGGYVKKGRMLEEYRWSKVGFMCPFHGMVS